MRINVDFPVQSLTTASISEVLQKLNLGDVVRAQVLEVTSGELLLKLLDGATFKASSMVSVDVQPGEFLDFYVKGKNENQILLETAKGKEIPRAGTENQQIKKELLSMDIKPSAKNMEIAKEIKANDVPFNKEVFHRVLQNLVKFKELDIAKAVFFEANQMELEQKNIGSLKQLTDGKQQVGKQLGDVLKLLGQVEDPKVLKNIARQLQQTSTPQVEQAAPEKIPVTAVRQDVPSPHHGQINTQSLSSQVVKMMEAHVGALTEEQSVVLQTKVENFLKSNPNGNTPEKLLVFLKKEMGDFKSFPAASSKLIKELSSHLLKEEEIHLPPERLKSIVDVAFKEVYIKLTGKNAQKEVNISETYKEMYQKLEMVKENVSQSLLPNKEEVMNKIDNLQNTMRFINDVSAHTTYIQLPVNIFDKENTAELYVLKKDSKRKRIDPENTTLFISLDTQYLGRFESLIGIHKKNITLNIRMQDQQIIAFMKENSQELYEKLSAMGYKLVDMKYRLVEDAVNLTNINRMLGKELPRNAGSIDLRL